MKDKGHSHRSIILFIVFGILITINWSCASLNAPLVLRPKSTCILQPLNKSSSSTWDIDSLYPIEGTILNRRQNTLISTYVELKGEGQYLLQLSTTRKNYKPLCYLLVASETGQVELSANIKWYIKPKRDIENISIALYRVDKSKSGKTETLTLLKQIRREYYVKKKRKLSKV